MRILYNIAIPNLLEFISVILKEDPFTDIHNKRNGILSELHQNEIKMFKVNHYYILIVHILCQ